MQYEENDIKNLIDFFCEFKGTSDAVQRYQKPCAFINMYYFIPKN